MRGMVMPVLLLTYGAALLLVPAVVVPLTALVVVGTVWVRRGGRFGVRR